MKIVNYVLTDIDKLKQALEAEQQANSELSLTMPETSGYEARVNHTNALYAIKDVLTPEPNDALQYQQLHYI